METDRAEMQGHPEAMEAMAVTAPVPLLFHKRSVWIPLWSCLARAVAAVTAAMAVMDYAMTLPELDHERILVAGHSRLGKTALLAGALDERFYCAFSNDSGCSGASLARENDGETIAKIVKAFPYFHISRRICPKR